MTRHFAPLTIGLVGAAILVALGLWQVQRLDWKRGILSEIETTIAGAPQPLPETPDAAAHRFLPVAVEGEIGAGELHVLVSRKLVGAGYRIIAPFETEAGRRILIDRGFVPTEDKAADRPAGPARLEGNLHWPAERSDFTPENDRDGNIWFAREVPVMAEALDTEPVLLVVREAAPGAPGITPLPVSAEGIPNDHLQYAITWFSLAVLWLAMTGLWLARGRIAKKGNGP